MPSVIVTLIHTPRPEGDRVFVNEDIDVWMGADTTVCTDCDAFADPPEAIAVAKALTLVAGCADTRWRPWHWIAQEANGEELACTPPGQWYTNREDCLKAIRTLFGHGVRVALDYGDDSDELLSLREPEDANPTSCSDSSLLAFGAAMLSDTTPDADADDGGTPDCGGTCCSHVTGDPDDDTDEYPIGEVRG